MIRWWMREIEGKPVNTDVGGIIRVWRQGDAPDPSADQPPVNVSIHGLSDPDGVGAIKLFVCAAGNSVATRLGRLLADQQRRMTKGRVPMGRLQSTTYWR
jgi:hypothetical protein